MELFHNIPHIHFMNKRHIMAALSACAFALSVFFILTKGINFGLDFTGGTQLELSFSKSYDTEKLHQVLEEGGFKNAKITNFGSSKDVLIRLVNRTADSQLELGKKLLKLLQTLDPQ